MTNPAAPDYASMAQALAIETRAFINGKLTTSLSGRTFSTENPATGRLLAQIAECREEDVNLAVAAARRAFDTGPWRKMPPRERKKVLLRLADFVERHAEELARASPGTLQAEIRDCLVHATATRSPHAHTLLTDLPTHPDSLTLTYFALRGSSADYCHVAATRVGSSRHLFRGHHPQTSQVGNREDVRVAA
jgi:Aldehyde dehydrogenase family